MKIEDQVCSFEQATKLRSLGLREKSEFNWVLHSAREEWKVTRKYSLDDFSFLPPLDAYTVAELGVLLGEYSLLKNQDEGRIYWEILDFYGRPKILKSAGDITFRNEAQARAEALIWLIENGFIDPTKLVL